MRITWQDTREYKTYTYRGHTIEKIKEGWVTTVPGDEFIYHSAETAHNAVDKMLGGKTRKANPVRHKFGIKIVGRKDGESECV